MLCYVMLQMTKYSMNKRKAMTVTVETIVPLIFFLSSVVALLFPTALLAMQVYV